MKTWSLLSLVCIFLVSCSDDEFKDVNAFSHDENIQTVNGNWKVISFEDLSPGKVEFQTEENSWGSDIIVRFDDTVNPHIIDGIVTTNSVSGSFEYLSARKINVLILGSTFVDQPEWADKFEDAILNYDLDFVVSDTRLRLYYNGRRNSVTLEKQ